MIIGANLRFGGSGGTSNGTRAFICPASSSTEAGLLFYHRRPWRVDQRGRHSQTDDAQ